MLDRIRPIAPRTHSLQKLWALLIAGVSWALSIFAQAAEPPKVSADHAARMKQGTTLFKERVRPLLVKHCLDCHGGKATKGDFDLSTREKLVESEVIEAALDKMRQQVEAEPDAVLA